MAKIKIHELAKSLNQNSKDIVAFLNQKGLDIKSHMSSIEDEAIRMVLQEFAPRAAKSAEPEEEAEPAVVPAEEAAPVRPARRPAAPEGGERVRRPRPEGAEARPEGSRPVRRRPDGSIVRPDGTIVRPDGTVMKPVRRDAEGRPIRPEGSRPVRRRPDGTIVRPDGTMVRPDGTVLKPVRRDAEGRPIRPEGAKTVKPEAESQPAAEAQAPAKQPETPEPVQTFVPDEKPAETPVTAPAAETKPAREAAPVKKVVPVTAEEIARRISERSAANRENRRDSRSGDRPSRGDGSRQDGQRGPRDGRRGEGRNDGRTNDRPGRNDRNDRGDRDNRGDRNERGGDSRGDSRSQGQRKSRPAASAAAPMDFAPSKDSKNRKAADQKNKNQKNNKYDKGNNSKYRDDLPDNKKDPNRKGAFIKPQVADKKPEEEIKSIVLPETITLRDLADKMKIQPSAIIKKFFLEGKMYSINQDLTYEEAEEIALEYDIIAEKEQVVDVIEEILKEDEEDESEMVKRPPVVCVMGHVDHGKTSLLDAIRSTNVTAREAGGITQHIGASVVTINGEKITFLDTPGHEAFTSMRMRGAQSTDIAVLVVAADDGIMPQTIEAINHAKAAGVEIIVAVNKIDKESANVDRVKQELTEYGLIAEDWGGSTVVVPVSAKTGEGISNLLEMILLTAEVMELKANPNRKARGLVIEAKLDKGRGSVATVLVQKGTLHNGDAIVIGSSFGRIRAMSDDKGRRLKEAGPSTPVEIIGLSEVPEAGEVFMVEDNEKEARAIAAAYVTQNKEKLLAGTKSKMSLDSLFEQIQEGNLKELNLIVKADVQGSVEAVRQSLEKLSNEEVAVRVIHGAVGNINESDVTLASASNAIIIGFNVKLDNLAKDLSEQEKVDVRLYRVIYNAIEDIEAAMKGMLDPVFEEKILGHAEIRQVFKASGVGSIAGSYVRDGKIIRGSKARITRDGKVIFDGPIASLKRFKDDVKEVATGYECGLVFEKFNDVQELDQVEVYTMVEVPR
ncbi:MAG: translation initiation factor IF-2 [Lachnospiraceae bacterium]|nr:translation initiation factor IF-2 [Lachnospiraceae bacterium]